MSNGLLADIEARAERRRTRTSDEMWQGLARAAFDRGQQERAQGDLNAALRWLERAHRLAPRDGLIRSALATVLLERGEAVEAAALFEDLAREYGACDAWSGLAAARLMQGRLDDAREAVAMALRSGVLTDALSGLALAVVQRLQLPGWCGLDGTGRVHAGPGRPSQIRLDGVSVKGRALPSGWQSARELSVSSRSGPFLGSPIPIRAIAGVEGFVEASAGGILGWARHPGDPGRDPLILVRGPGLNAMLRLDLPADLGPGGNPFAHPRRIELSPTQVQSVGSPLAITDASGTHLLGSPLDPGIETRAAFAPVWVDAVGGPPRARDDRPPADIVIPVYRGQAETLACIASVLASVPPDTVVHVVEDASPDPGLVAALEELAASARISLLRQADNRGFPATANAGIRAASGRDVIVLNSDTLVPPGWLDRLRAAAYAAPDIGTATPLSNDATIVSYPGAPGTNPIPDLPQTERLDRLAQRANPGVVADLPVGIGFCLYLRRDCLDQIGLFREDLFAQGYGEENDLCLRARHAGWRNVAATDVFVAHVGARSFGTARAHLIRRNTAILNRLHPGYNGLIDAHLAADPLLPARRRMDALRWREGRRAAGAVILVTHGEGGGVDRVVAARCEAAQAAGLRAVVLRPGRGRCRVESPAEATPNLIYAIPDEMDELAALLHPDRPVVLELHHLLGHDHAILGLARRLQIPIDAFVHDYAWFCPRIALVGRERRYCGEPDIAGCEDCIADLGGLLDDEIPVPALRARSASDLALARRVVAPSQDAATRLRRHFPSVRPVVEPWEDDRALPPLAPDPNSWPRRVCIVGAIGPEKGYDVLLQCVRDAGRRNLPLEFVVCGFTADDERLLAAGPAFVTGRYRDEEAVALIRAQRAQVALLPSVWPETWCFALSRAWQAGLPAVAFDLGAQAERIRATGRGWLLPPNLPSRAVNDALLNLAPLSLPSQCPPRTCPTPQKASRPIPCQTPPTLPRK